MANIANRVIRDSTASERQRPLTVECGNGIAHEVQYGLHHLVSIKVYCRQARVVVAANRDISLVLCFYYSDYVLEQFVNIQRLLVGRAAGSEQCVDERRESVCFTDDYIGVFAKFGVIQLSLEELCCTANSAQGVFDLMRKLANHLATGAVLNQQRVLAAYLRAPCNVGDFDEQTRIICRDRRDAAIDSAFVIVRLGWREAHFVCVMIAGFDNATKDVTQLGLVVDELQQGLSSRALNADAKNVFGGWIQADD